jgi:hypothetical protein
MVTTVRQRLAGGLRNELGQGLVDCSRILLFVSVIAVAVIAFVGPDVSRNIAYIANSL